METEIVPGWYRTKCYYTIQYNGNRKIAELSHGNDQNNILILKVLEILIDFCQLCREPLT